MTKAKRWSGLAFGVVGMSCIGLSGVARANTIELVASYANYTGGEGEWGVRASNFSGLNVSPQAFLPHISGNTDNLFQTFCLEADEPLVSHNNDVVDVESGGSHAVYTWEMNDTALRGGNNSNTGDPLDPRTAYLFTAFYNGVLSNYNYTPGTGRLASSHSLNLAIWYIEEEIASSQLDSQAQAWVTEANNAGWTTIHNVRVMNLYESNGNYAQDLLILVPLPPAVWIGLGLLSMVGAAGIIRRRRASSHLN